MEDGEGFECHLFETWLVCCCSAAAVGSGVFPIKVFGVDITVEPFGHIGDGEDAEVAGGVVGGL